MKRSVRWLPRSLVGRVFALYTVTLLAFVGAGLVAFYRYQFTVELDAAQLRADALSEVVVPALADSAVIGDYDTIRRTLQRAVHHSSFSAASFIDVKGGVVRAPRDEPPEVAPPEWLRRAIADRLYDTNKPISVGGHDYGVLRLSFSYERIAGRLWEQTCMVIALAGISVIGGLLVIRFPLVRWLGNLSRIQAFERTLLEGRADPALLTAEDAPTEFRQTFEVLGRAAASLQSQRVQAAVTLGAIADGVFTLDREGRVVLMNPAAARMAACESDALLGQVAADRLPQLFTDGPLLSPWVCRRATLAADAGHAVVVDSTLSTIIGPDGAPTGWVLACRDVSAQHRLETQLRQELKERESAMAALRQVLEGLTPDAAVLAPTGRDDLAAVSAMISSLVTRLQVRGEQLDAIFALSPDGFVSFDARRRANYVSPAFLRLTGLPAEQVLGADEEAVQDQLSALCDRTRPWSGFAALRQALRDQIDGGTARRQLIELQRPQRRVLEAGLREGSTEAIAQVLSLRDVTHETEVDQMKSEFLSTAAHELRTPMTSIYGFTELLARRKMSPERQAEVIATIHRQTELMLKIVNELLDLARIEARRGQDFDLQTLDLATLATQVVHDFKPPQDRPGPCFDQPRGPLPVRADRDKLAQAIANVLSNAYKYSPSGGDVILRWVEDEGCAWAGLQISDAGIGMTPQQLSRVSERFYRADASGNIPGTGLGMSIVKEIVELLGGRLALESELGRGTMVTLWLPLATEARLHQALETVE
jgi:signal transduction histidine kinase